MAAYLIMTRIRTDDPARLETYAAIAATAPPGSARLVASTKAGRSRTLEGNGADAVAIIRFDSWDDAMAWYDSPEYTEARQHRLASGEFATVLIEADEPCR